MPRYQPMAVRLKDIAAELGVSIVTVSKVLRDKPDVSAATRARVLQRVQELNYKPNMLARGLASGRSYTVGLIVPDLTDPFFAELAKSLGAALRGHAYQLLLASADDDPSVEQHEIENLLNRGVDVLLLASCQQDSDRMAGALKGRVPCVLIDRMPQGAKAHFVGTDDVLAGRLATAHLLSLGRRRIAHLGSKGVSTSFDRLRGYRLALQDSGLPVTEELVRARALQPERVDVIGRAAMDDLLALPEPPDAVFCYNDLLAVGAIRSVLAHGLRVPEDVAVIGCGNLALSSYLEVPLSSVDQGTGELGRMTAELALSLTEKKVARPYRRLLVTPQVVERASTSGRSNA